MKCRALILNEGFKHTVSIFSCSSSWIRNFIAPCSFNFKAINAFINNKKLPVCFLWTTRLSLETKIISLIICLTSVERSSMFDERLISRVGALDWFLSRVITDDDKTRVLDLWSETRDLPFKGTGGHLYANES